MIGRIQHHWRQWLFRAGLLLGSLLLGIQVWLTAQSLQKAPLSLVAPRLLLAAWGAIGAATVIQVLAWQVIMIGLRVEVNRWRLAQGYLLPFVARYIPGSVWGYLGRSQWMYQHYNIPYSKTNVASAIEVLSVLTSGLIVLCAYSVVKTAGAARLGFAGLAAIAPILVWFGMRLAVVRRLSAFLPASIPYVAILQTLPFRIWAGVLSLHLVLWLCYGFALRMTVGSLELIGSPDLLTSTFMFTFAWLIGFFILFIPSGLGVRELMLSTLLTTVVAASSSVGTAAALLLRLLLLVTEVTFVAALVGSSMLHRKDKYRRAGPSR
jgi:hypothetical protein